MAKGATRDKRRETRWRRLVRDHKRSGLTVRQFCHENDLPESAFYYWRRELLRRDAARDEAKQEQRKRPSTSTRPVTPAAFVPVTVTQEARPDAARIEIELPGGQRVHVTAPVDRQALADVLAVLEDRHLEAQPC